MIKKVYAAAPGVPWVNGAPVPDDRLVVLSEAEADFDVGYARIALDEAATEAREKIIAAGQRAIEAIQAIQAVA